MKQFDTMNVVGFGKVTYIPRNHSVPALPDMNLIVFKDNETYQAICIDIEVDSIGDSMEAACRNLKNRLLIYTTQMVHNYNNNIKAAAEDIINVAYSQGELKSSLFKKYIQAKQQYLLSKIAKENKAKSRKEDIKYAFGRIFQFEPIRLNLTLAAGMA